MATKIFNIYVQALTSVARKVLATQAMLDACQQEGVNESDWLEIAEQGQAAESADLLQSAAQRRLTVSQAAFSDKLALMSKCIKDIKLRKKAICRNLTKANASPEDILFVRELSFAVRAQLQTSGDVKKQALDSAAQDAQALQLSRMSGEIAARPAVAQAFAERGITQSVLKQMQELPTVVSQARDQRNKDYNDWIVAGQLEREAALEQSIVWDNIRRGVARVSKKMVEIKNLLIYLKDAKERTKTVKKRAPRKPQIPAVQGPTIAA